MNKKDLKELMGIVEELMEKLDKKPEAESKKSESKKRGNGSISFSADIKFKDGLPVYDFMNMTFNAYGVSNGDIMSILSAFVLSTVKGAADNDDDDSLSKKEKYKNLVEVFLEKLKSQVDLLENM